MNVGSGPGGLHETHDVLWLHWMYWSDRLDKTVLLEPAVYLERSNIEDADEEDIGSNEEQNPDDKEREDENTSDAHENTSDTQDDDVSSAPGRNQATHAHKKRRKYQAEITIQA